MKLYENLERPSKKEQLIAKESYDALASILEDIDSNEKEIEIEIEETSEKLVLPIVALKLLAKILKVTSEGKPISIVPIATEMTTQAAAEILGCSRPHLVKLLESNRIPYTLVGKHRRVKYEDVMKYRKKMKEKQKQALIRLMKSDEDLGMYDT